MFRCMFTVMLLCLIVTPAPADELPELIFGPAPSRSATVQDVKPHLPTPPFPNCQCGCTETGKCTCKDCDHPCLDPATKGTAAKQIGALTIQVVTRFGDRTITKDKTVFLGTGQKPRLNLNYPTYYRRAPQRPQVSYPYSGPPIHYAGTLGNWGAVMPFGGCANCR